MIARKINVTSLVQQSIEILAAAISMLGTDPGDRIKNRSPT